MSNQKRYTAQAMRDAADTMDECLREMEDGNSMYWRDDHITSEDWKAMLRQAADAEEDLAELRDQVNRDFGESVSLRARLDAVVKECERNEVLYRNDETFVEKVERVRHNEPFLKILRAARGEESSSQQTALNGQHRPE